MFSYHAGNAQTAKELQLLLSVRLQLLCQAEEEIPHARTHALPTSYCQAEEEIPAVRLHALTHLTHIGLDRLQRRHSSNKEPRKNKGR